MSPCFALIQAKSVVFPPGPQGSAWFRRRLAQRGGSGDVVTGCSPEKSYFPTSDPMAVARAAPRLAGADGQLGDYLY